MQQIENQFLTNFTNLQILLISSLQLRLIIRHTKTMVTRVNVSTSFHDEGATKIKFEG